MRKTVSFGDKPPPPYTVNDPAGAAPDAPSLQEVKDLCASIQQLHKSSPCIGFSFDTKSKLRGTYAVDALDAKQMTSSEFFTLEQLLVQPPLRNGRAIRLSKKERYSLALTLASSTLQLNATPWFKDEWCAKDIVFHQTDSGPRLVDIDRPYVGSKAELRTAVNNAGAKRGFQNKNTVLLALAVALLELYFGVSAENRQGLEEQPVGAFNPWMRCAMVYQWADEEQENLSAAFSGAVSKSSHLFLVDARALISHCFQITACAASTILAPICRTPNSYKRLSSASCFRCRKSSINSWANRVREVCIR